MKKLINFDEVGGSLHVNYCSGAWLGEIYREVDGFYVFWPNRDRTGFWTQCVLALIADKLAELNKAWSEEIEKDYAYRARPQSIEQDGIDRHSTGLDEPVC